MNQVTLEEYRCRRCGRAFYIDAAERSDLDLDFGCPHSCDDGSERMRNIVAEVKETADGRVNDFRIKDCQIVLLLSPEEFELSMGRTQLRDGLALANQDIRLSELRHHLRSTITLLHEYNLLSWV